MDCDIDAKNKNKSILSRFGGRSTKVEPQPSHCDGENSVRTVGNVGEQQTVSAHSSPIRNIRQQFLRRSNSSQNLSDNIISVQPVSSNRTPNLSRLSHQFSLCCSIDIKSVTPPPQGPPVSVRYNSFSTSSINNVGDQQPAVVTSPSVRSGASNSINENPAGVSKPQETESIAMSSCRSRFRQKFLPPKSNNLIEPTAVTKTELPSTNYFLVNPISNDNHHQSDGTSTTNVPNPKQKIKRASTNSLVKQSLMAAQVLNLIPTEKARERNYLVGRLAVNSLLGQSELERVMPSRSLTIFVGTWNMNGQHPPKQMMDFVLPSNMAHVPDLVVIGTQESCSERFEWEVTLQETLGPSHILLHSASLGTLHLAVFIRRDLIWFCSVPEDANLSVRPGTAFRTKGAVAISFCIFGTTMLFVTSHLTAHQQKVKERVSDVRRITHSMDLPRNLNLRSKSQDITQNFDVVYWFGDLNFRLGEPRDNILRWIETTKFPLPPHLPHGYMHTDQLKSILSNGAAFKDFKEANITFPPTYKYDPGTQNFDTSAKQRAPAYTDRILYKCKSGPSGLRRGSSANVLFFSNQIDCLAYDSVPSIVTSDHKPVWALFKNAIRPGNDSIPLAAGLFNRDVYVEGMKRRLNNSSSSSSMVCVLQ